MALSYAWKRTIAWRIICRRYWTQAIFCAVCLAIIYAQLKLLTNTIIGTTDAAEVVKFCIHRRHTSLARVGTGHVQEHLTGQSLIDYIGANLHVRYFRRRGSKYGHQIQLMNAGSSTIPSTEYWAIFFNHAGGVNVNMWKSSRFQGLRVVHVDGWLYKIEPALGWSKQTSFRGIRPRENVTLRVGADLLSRSYAFPRWYVADSPSSNVQPRIIANTDDEMLRFVDPFAEEWTGESRFAANERLVDGITADNSTSSETLSISIIPTPLSVVRPSATSVTVSKNWAIYYEIGLENEVYYLADMLGISVKQSLTSTEELKQNNGDEIIVLSKRNLSLELANFDRWAKTSLEAYKLTVSPNTKRINIIGQSAAGVFYGVQSLMSLLDGSPDKRSAPSIEVVDAPRLPYRGLLLDVARNFISKPDLMKIMSTMAMYKMNKLHLHLTDDQGWRFEVPGLPELTQVGARRGHDIHEASSLKPYLGVGPYTSNPYGNGYYSVEDYREILRHASALHIEVIPEVDMPGHSHAAMQSMRVRHARKNSSTEENFRLTDPEDTSAYLAVNYHRDTVMNPCIESTYNFIEKVLRTLNDLHKPLKRIHLGGDEVPKGALVDSPACHRLLGPDVRNRPDQFKPYFMQRAFEIAKRLGLDLQVWQDGLKHENGEPTNASQWANLTPGKETGGGINVNVWREDVGRVMTYARNGYKVILSQSTDLYLDHPQEPDVEEYGLYWATRSISMRRVFELQPPVECLHNIGDDKRPAECENIIGIEASLWGELVRTSDQIDYMIFPRLLAVAERSWHVADWQMVASDMISEQQRLLKMDWKNFVLAVGRKELRRLDRLGIRYRIPPPGVRVVDKSTILVNSEIPGLRVEYSVDDGATWIISEHGLTLSPLALKLDEQEETRVLFQTRSNDMRRSSRMIGVR